jgi:hypothetical protein
VCSSECWRDTGTRKRVKLGTAPQSFAIERAFISGGFTGNGETERSQNVQCGATEYTVWIFYSPRAVPQQLAHLLWQGVLVV